MHPSSQAVPYPDANPRASQVEMTGTSPKNPILHKKKDPVGTLQAKKTPVITCPTEIDMSEKSGPTFCRENDQISPYRQSPEAG